MKPVPTIQIQQCTKQATNYGLTKHSLQILYILLVIYLGLKMSRSCSNI